MNDWENGPEWTKWQSELQAELPLESAQKLRARIREFHQSNQIKVDLPTADAEFLEGTKVHIISERAPRWLGYAGAAIAVLATCVATILFTGRQERAPLNTSLIDRGEYLTSVNPQAFPSMMVSLTSPRNAIQTFPKIRNASFEDLEYRRYQTVSQSVPGWIFPSRCKDAGYRAEVDSTERCDGQRSAIIESTVDQPGLFGNLMQTLDATMYRNKTVRLSAALRADVPDNGSQVQMWLRIDNEDMSIGFFDSMQDRPVRTNEWQYAVIIAKVSQNAQYINVGAFLIGNGTAWLDDFQLEINE